MHSWVLISLSTASCVVAQFCLMDNGRRWAKKMLSANNALSYVPTDEVREMFSDRSSGHQTSESPVGQRWTRMP